ncbi:hypothetical protein C8J57DRAFT_1270811 [Mycena rebaudengoi]|nr:hypothetical protein C8J57DRAFT_1270811 [Mycena rebaudengoi]
MADSIARLNFIIIGASVAGLSSAIALIQSGHNVVVLERESQLGGTSSMQSGCARVPPNGCKILYDWGLEEEIRENAAVSAGFDIYKYNTPDKDFIGSHRWDPEVLSEARGQFVQFLHKDLLRILYDAAIGLPERLENHVNLTEERDISFPRVDVLFGAEVVGIDCDAGSVTLKSGEIRTADAIIGADGASGVVRKALLQEEGAESDGTPTDLALYGVTIPEALAAKEGLTDPNTRLWVGPNRGAMAYCTGKENDIALMIYTPDSSPNGSWAEEAEQKLTDIVGACDVQIQKLVALAGPAICVQVQDHYELESWVSESGKVLAIGEAAHPFPPGAVYTYSIALEDGAFIGKIFSHTRDAKRVPEFLSAFAEHRGPRCARILETEKQTIRYMTLPDGEMQIGRDAAMRASHAAGRNVMDAPSGDLQDMHDDLRMVFGYDPADDADEWWMTWGRFRDAKTLVENNHDRPISWTSVSSSQTRYYTGEENGQWAKSY